jgi:hypothetical protein
LDSVVVRPVDVLSHPRERQLSLYRNHRELFRQWRQASRRRSSEPGDWRVILDRLMERTPEYEPPQDGIMVVIPRDSMPLLLSDHSRNLWNIKSRSQCANMTLYQPADEDTAEAGQSERPNREGASSYIMLSGQPAAIIATIGEILKVAESAQVVNLQGSSGVLPHPLRDSLLANAAQMSEHKLSLPHKHYRLNMRADEIRPPREWTFQTFYQYIAALVMGHLPRGLSARHYGPGPEDSHTLAVVAQIRAAFHDPAAAAAVSSPALKLALSYLTRSGVAYLNVAWALLARVGELGLPLDTKVLNMMAETTAKSRDLFAFQSMLDLMAAHDLKPDTRTWRLFLRMIEAEEVRRYILHSMHAKGFFSDHKMAIPIASEMAGHDAYRAIQLGHDAHTFLAGLRELYGPEWRMSTGAANKYLDVLCRHGKFEDSRIILKHMWAEGVGKPDSVSLNTVISHCRSQLKVDLAVDMVRLFDERGPSVADELTVRLLLDLARKSRKPHLFGAVWRYAHLVSLASAPARHHAWKLLRSAADGPSEVLKLTYRIQNLWKSPIECKVPKTQFVSYLMLCDYQKAVGHAGQVTIDGAPGGEEPSLQKLPESTQQSPPLQADKEGKRPPTNAKSLYEPFVEWMYGRSKTHAPDIGFGTFLKAALARDYRLTRLALEGVGELRHGVPVDLLPEDLPMRRVMRVNLNVNGMLTWEGAIPPERDGGVTQEESGREAEDKDLDVQTQQSARAEDPRSKAKRKAKMKAKPKGRRLFALPAKKKGRVTAEAEDAWDEESWRAYVA